MTTLAGRKIAQFRDAQQPKLSREAFGARYGVAMTTVMGWEAGRQRPSSPEVVNRIAADGIASHAEWFVAAECPACGLPSDAAEAQDCDAKACPIASFHGRTEAAA
jgi:transcriptional regulator with XRE-family HTH domain